MDLLNREEFLNESFDALFGTDSEDMKIANEFEISLDQLNTLRNLKRDQPLKLKTPDKEGNEKINFTSIDIKGGYIQYYYKSGRGRGSTTMKIKDFFDKVNIRIIKYEDPEEVLIGLKPSNKDIEKIKSLGSTEYSYSSGGFPTSSKLRYNDVSKNDEKKANSLANRIKTRADIIRLTKAVKSVFGSNYNTPYDNFLRRCKELKCKDAEIADIKDYKEVIDTTNHIKF